MTPEFLQINDQNYSTIVKSLPLPQPVKTEKLLAAKRYVQEVKSRFIEQPDRYVKFRQELVGTSSQMIEQVDDGCGSVKIYFERVSDDAVERLKVALEGHNDLILGLNSFLPDSLLVDDIDNTLVDRVAGRQAEERVIELQSDKLDCIIQKSSSSFGSSSCGQIEAAKTEDPRTKDSEEETNGDGPNGEDIKGESLGDQWCRFLMRVDEKLPCLERRVEFMRHLDNFHVGLINKAELDMGVASMIGVHKDLMEEFNFVLSRHMNLSLVKAKLKFGEKRKLEYCCEERPTPSSKKRPGKRNRPSDDESPSVRRQGKRSHLIDDVSNDLCGCKLSLEKIDGKSTIDHRFQEEIKLRIEDFFNEVDVLLSWLRGAIDFADKSREGWYDENHDGTIKKTLFRRCVEQMYGEHAMDALRMFEEDPKHTLSIIIPRLVKKEKELADYRKVLGKNIWESKRLRQQLGIE